MALTHLSAPWKQPSLLHSLSRTFPPSAFGATGPGKDIWRLSKALASFWNCLCCDEIPSSVCSEIPGILDVTGAKARSLCFPKLAECSDCEADPWDNPPWHKFGRCDQADPSVLFLSGRVGASWDREGALRMAGNEVIWKIPSHTKPFHGVSQVPEEQWDQGGQHSHT